MLINLLFQEPVQFLMVLVALILAITFHEFAHAYVSEKLGDATAKLSGRLSLNPAAHLDPLGTLFLLFVGFGWGKPVPVNPHNFKNPSFDELKVSLAGPLSNFILALIFATLLYLPGLPAVIYATISTIIFLNLILMVFNLLPLPPLDGSKILKIFLSEEAYFRAQRLGLPILLGLILLSYLGIPIIPFILNQIVGGIFTLLTGQNFTF